MAKHHSAIVVKNLTKSFSKESKGLFFKKEKLVALRKVSFNVTEGEVFGVIGPNGSGKSTLIRILSTLLLPDSGIVKVAGHDVVKEAAKVRDLINRVSVEAAFYKMLSARENLVYSAILYGENPRIAEIKGAAILGKLGLRLDAYDEPLENMSRGMQQKIAITRALLSSPKVILLDEPTTGLDPRAKRAVQNFLLDMKKKYQPTIILTSHDMTEIEKLCDKIAFINHGEIIKQGTVAELRSKSITLEDAFIKLLAKSTEVDEYGEED
jgi:ABC-2 type transport system ATP-binding protein